MSTIDTLIQELKDMIARVEADLGIGGAPAPAPAPEPAPVDPPVDPVDPPSPDVDPPSPDVSQDLIVEPAIPARDTSSF